MSLRLPQGTSNPQEGTGEVAVALIWLDTSLTLPSLRLPPSLLLYTHTHTQAILIFRQCSLFANSEFVTHLLAKIYLSPQTGTHGALGSFVDLPKNNRDL